MNPIRKRCPYVIHDKYGGDRRCIRPDSHAGACDYEPELESKEEVRPPEDSFFVRWARLRIEECRRQELKFANHPIGKGPPQALIEAWTERQTLERVLEMTLEKKGPVS